MSSRTHSPIHISQDNLKHRPWLHAKHILGLIQYDDIDVSILIAAFSKAPSVQISSITSARSRYLQVEKVRGFISFLCTSLEALAAFARQIVSRSKSGIIVFGQKIVAVQR